MTIAEAQNKNAESIMRAIVRVADEIMFDNPEIPTDEALVMAAEIYGDVSSIEFLKKDEKKA